MLGFQISRFLIVGHFEKVGFGGVLENVTLFQAVQNDENSAILTQKIGHFGHHFGHYFGHHYFTYLKFSIWITYHIIKVLKKRHPKSIPKMMKNMMQNDTKKVLFL